MVIVKFRSTRISLGQIHADEIISFALNQFKATHTQARFGNSTKVVPITDLTK